MSFSMKDKFFELAIENQKKDSNSIKLIESMKSSYKQDGLEGLNKMLEQLTETYVVGDNEVTES
ncbi:MAG: hypothetical protein OEY49_18350 [Candidatus Heimdallarchaeota archaeon]|nr:hypothetical protein [Candidatus Heimdallarchaeota archaeon]